MRYRDLLCESTDLSLTLTERDVDDYYYEDGQPTGQYMFVIAEQDVPLVYVVVGVNIIMNDERTGLDTLYVVDMFTHRKNVANSERKFDTTNTTNAYSLGARLGYANARALFKQMVERVKQDFPDIRYVEGRRTTGTRHKFKANPHVKFDMSRATT